MKDSPMFRLFVYQDSFFVSVLTINSIVYGLQYLFLEPNPEDPLNKEAANELQVRRKKTIIKPFVAKLLRHLVSSNHGFNR